MATAFCLMTTKLEESQAARQRQLAAIVHELARPLAGMHAAVETLLDDDPVSPEMSNRLLTGIAGELGRLEGLVDILQSLDRRTFQPLQLRRAPIAMGRNVGASVAMFEPLAVQMDIALTLTLPDDLPELFADEDRLIQVMTNLLDNAIKFTPRGGSIRVTVTEAPDAVCVSVGNSGMGIAPEELPHLFQQFYRGNESRPPEKQGMGLGLTLCREIIAAHQGQICVESEPGEGAKFSFSLPKYGAAAPALAHVAKPG